MLRRLTLPVVLVLVVWLCAVPGTRTLSAQASPLIEALTAYSNGQFAGASEYLARLSSMQVLQSDLEHMSQTWLAGSGAMPARAARRGVVGFALEAATQHLSDPNAAKLVEWACRLVRDDRTPDEFDRRWQMAALAVMEGAVQPKLLATHVDHVLAQLPGDPRLTLGAALADDQRTGPWTLKGSAILGDALDAAESALRKYQAAAKYDSVRAEADVRAGYLDLRLHRDQAALDTLETVDHQTTDPALVYLARLFRGRAFERLNRPTDALAAYAAALQIVPGAHAATMAGAALLALQNQRVDAEAIIEHLLVTDDKADDPWWTYWAGDFRFIDRLLEEMREAMKS